MKIFNIEIRLVPKQGDDSEIIKLQLRKSEINAKIGLIQARLDLRTHEMLLEDAPRLNRTEAEIQAYKDAIENDRKSINNFETQLKAIQHERN